MITDGYAASCCKHNINLRFKRVTGFNLSVSGNCCVSRGAGLLPEMFWTFLTSASEAVQLIEQSILPVCVRWFPGVIAESYPGFGQDGGPYCLAVSECDCMLCKWLCVCFRLLWRKPFPVWRWRLLIGMGGRRLCRHTVSFQFHHKALPLFYLSLPLSCPVCQAPCPLSNTSTLLSCLLPCRCSWSLAHRGRKCRLRNNSAPQLLFIYHFFVLSVHLIAYFGALTSFCADL